MDMNPNSAHQFPEWPSENWVDPIEERAKLRQRLQRFRLGFGILGLSLVVFSLDTIGDLITMFHPGPGLGQLLEIPHFRLIEGAIISWGAVLGVLLLCGPWPDRNWQMRSGLLLILSLVDGVIWALDNGSELGLYDGKFGHEWFLESLARVNGWSEFALMASLTADAAIHLGQPKAAELARSARSLTTTGAMVWFMFFVSRTDWSPPLWPLHTLPRFNLGTVVLLLSYRVMFTIVLVQVTLMSLLAARCCGRVLREMAMADHANDALPSRSEDGWDDMIGKSGPKV